MKLYVYETAQQAAKAAATLLSAQIIEKPNCVLGLATGSTPVLTYKELVSLHEQGIVDFSKVITYNLDEYVNLPEEHEQSYHYFMKENLFDHVNIDMSNTHVPNGNAEDLAAAAAAYEQAIRSAGGIDLQLLGIGRNGHIGFNEPGDCFMSDCRVADLTQSTIQANCRFFDSENDVPRQAVTLGIGSIMSAKKIMLMATGQDKAQAVYDTLHSVVTPRCPSTILRMHPNVIMMVDKEAATLL